MRLNSVSRLLKPIERGLKTRVLGPMKLHLRFQLARRYRWVLRAWGKTCFLGVTGSCGKTTTTELIAAILAKEGRVRKGSHENTPRFFAKTILAVSPWHRFCVSEISADMPGVMEESTKLLQPRIGVVTHVGQDHYGHFRNLEATAVEKGKLVEALPADGVAVLNADDLVLLKGTERTDHLHRIVLSRMGGIACWRERCGKYRFCSDCRLLHSPAGP